MTSSPPAPDESPVFRGNTLTPESPRPVHVPEPTNIPVLENQIDPVFNLMSTHLASTAPTASVPAMELPPEQNLPSDPLLAAAAPSDANIAAANTTTQEIGEGTQETEASVQEAVAQGTDISYPQNEPNENVESGPVSHAPAAHPADDPRTLDNAALLTVVTSAHDAPASLQHAPTREDDQPQSFNAGDTPTVALSAEALTAGSVNYQALIDSIIPSGTTDLAPDSDAAAVSAPQDSEKPALSSSNLSSPSLPIFSASLPPRPPPQEKPSIHPNYNPEEDIRAYHFPNLAQPSPTTPQNGAFPGASSFPTSTPGTNHDALPATAPPANYGYSRQNEPSERSSYQSQRAQNAAARRHNQGDREDNAPWGPEIQKMYDQYLADESVYTAEGTWDRFPKDSRLFVGNLPTDIVTKRDIFHIFYRYGRLAQISIKNAYGFVQFMDESACRNAMNSEQGKKIKDKSMHLEISKPPKNSRNATVSAAGERLRASHYRRSRSRSPDHDRRPMSRSERDRHNRGSGDFRDQFRRGRDDYRPGRSPSPPSARGGRDSYRGRDRSADRYGGSRRDRSRSPYGRHRNRSPSPRRGYEDDGVPLPRRDARDIPEVQLIVVDQLDRGFVEFVQHAFRSRTLSVAAFPLPSQVSLDAMIKRQILEGVMAVVKLYRENQVTGKIPVQIFDRSGGRNSVRFDEYRDLEPHIAASLVIQSKQKQATVALNAQPQYGAAALQQLGVNLPAQPLQQQRPNAGPPNLANLITQLDGPTLQALLGAMQQTPQTPQSAHLPPSQPSPTHNAGFGNVMGGHIPPQQPQQPGSAGPGFGYPGAQHHGGPPPQFAAFPASQPQPQPQPQQQQQAFNYPQNGPPSGSNQVQDLMSQLAATQWRR